MAEDLISLDAIVTLTPDLLTANLDDDLVLLNTRTARYHALGGAGSHIYRLLDQPRTVQEICEAMTATFDVSFDACQRDVTMFLTAMLREELVVVT